MNTGEMFDWNSLLSGFPRSAMRIAGLVLLIVGGFFIGGASRMDIMVETGDQTIGSGEFAMQIPRSRVVNFTLMDKRRDYLELGGLGILSGLILIGFGTLAQKQASSTDADEGAAPEAQTRRAPPPLR